MPKHDGFYKKYTMTYYAVACNLLKGFVAYICKSDFNVSTVLQIIVLGRTLSEEFVPSSTIKSSHVNSAFLINSKSAFVLYM